MFSRPLEARTRAIANRPSGCRPSHVSELRPICLAAGDHVLNNDYHGYGPSRSLRPMCLKAVFGVDFFLTTTRLVVWCRNGRLNHATSYPESIYTRKSPGLTARGPDVRRYAAGD